MEGYTIPHTSVLRALEVSRQRLTWLLTLKALIDSLGSAVRVTLTSFAPATPSEFRSNKPFA